MEKITNTMVRFDKYLSANNARYFVILLVGSGLALITVLAINLLPPMPRMAVSIFMYILCAIAVILIGKAYFRLKGSKK